jgi:phosphatidylinositol-3-phosphatase
MAGRVLGVRPRTSTATIGFALLLSAMAPAMVAGLVLASPSPAVPQPAAAGAYFDYLVIILMENHNLCEILTSCGGTASYMTSLANQYGLLTEDRYCSVNPSLPNYLCLTGGSDFGCSGYDGYPNTNPCTTAAWNAENIVDRLESAGLTWKAYMEDMPSACYASDVGRYVAHHNPFVYYSDIASNPIRCSRVVPAGNAASNLIADLDSPSTAPNFMWLTPNNCNNMHSCRVPDGDLYLSNLVPRIAGSAVFTSRRAALFITFDEGSGNSQPIFSIWVGTPVKPAYKSSAGYNHYSFLATVESNWNLAPLTANDRDAPSMYEFFSGQPSRPGSSGAVPLWIWPVLGAVFVGGAAVLGAIVLRRRRVRGPPPPKKSP